MIDFTRRAARAVQWRANALLGTGANVPDGPVESFEANEVADYYDEATSAYLKATGPFLQAFRGQDTDDLMEYYVRRCGIVDGMTILDAGCGVAAPAIWLARRFPSLKVTGMTVSPVQAEMAQSNAREAGVDDRVHIELGDYHELSSQLSHDQFDLAIFLESLGHSSDIRRVLYGVGDVLKPKGRVYVKDFFQRRSLNPELQAKIDKVIDTINANYRYHVMQLPDLVAACMETGFGVSAVSPPEIEPDLKLTVDFEHEVGQLTYPAYARFPAVDWYEVIATRE